MQAVYISPSWRSGLIQEFSYRAQQHTPLCSLELYAQGLPRYGLHGPPVVAGLTTLGTLVGGLVFSLSGYRVLLRAEAAGHW